MSLHQKAFWTMSFWLAGVAMGSLVHESEYRVLIALCLWGVTLSLLLLYQPRRSIFIIIGLIGSFYFFWFDARSQVYTLTESIPISSEVLVKKVVRQENQQTIDVSVRDMPSMRLRVYADLYPTIRYGDVLEIGGSATPPDKNFASYYLKEKIGGIVSRPQIQILEHSQGSVLFAGLFTIRDYVASQFKQFLPANEATFLTGLTLGKSAGFSKEFKEKLSKTGTTHLVALSGYNVAIIAVAIASICGLFFSYTTSFLLSITGIVMFVLMTGAEASVVRAGIMAVILLIAERSSRVYSMKNAVAAAASVMTFINPYVLSFDVGFQLSFAALLGIVYLKPSLEKAMRLMPKEGVLGWRSALMTTLSAQLVVLPILLMQFGYVSLIAIIPNILILTFVPATMLMGALIIGLGIVSQTLASVVAFVARILVRYELSVIELFSQFSFGISTESFLWVLFVSYYAILIGVIIYARNKNSLI